MLAGFQTSLKRNWYISLYPVFTFKMMFKPLLRSGRISEKWCAGGNFDLHQSKEKLLQSLSKEPCVDSV